MTSFVNVIRNIFAGYNGYCPTTYIGPSLKKNDNHIIEIPLNTPMLEIPTFAIGGFNRVNHLSVRDFKNVEALVMNLYNGSSIPRYKTVEKYMKDVLLKRRDYATYDGFINLEVSGEGNNRKFYHAIHGTVLNDDMKPVMMCLWRMKNIDIDNSESKYEIIEPVIRIDPDIYVKVLKNDGCNAIDKFIIKKFIPDALITKVYFARQLPDSIYDNPTELQGGTSIKVELSPCPFNIVKTAVPSINTTNEKLLDAVKKHMKDLKGIPE